jgi:hypothetical protein
MIELKKCSSDISTLFEEYLEELSKPKYDYYGCGSRYFDDWYDDEWDNYYDDYYDGYGNLFGGYHTHHSKKKRSTIDDTTVVKKGHKRGKRGKKKFTNKVVPLYDYDKDAVSLYDSDEVTIYFYRDINNPDDKDIYYNLYEFNDFLENEGIYVSEYEVRQLMNRNISHCCIDPSVIGIKSEPWLISDSSYGGLSWNVSGDNDELLSQEYSLHPSDDLPF